MLRILSFLSGLLLAALPLAGQTVTTDPLFFRADQPVTITINVRGTTLEGHTQGVWLWAWLAEGCTTGCDAPTNVDPASPAAEGARMTRSATDPNTYTIRITPTTFFNRPASAISRIGMKAKSQAWADNRQSDRDLFITPSPAGELRVSFLQPIPVSGMLFNSGEAVAIRAEASEPADLTLTIGGTQVRAVSNATVIEHTHTVTETGTTEVRLTARRGSTTATASFSYSVRMASPVAPMPAGLRMGPNYHANDPTKATLVLQAPGKSFAHVIGDFNNWQTDTRYQMNRTPDGEFFWLELTGLEAGKRYVYQYQVDGTIKIGDPFAELVADPWNDQFIPPSIFPGLVDYRRTANGIATYLQTNQQPYEWKFPEVAGGPIPKENLMIYELLVRDFVNSHSYREVADSLDYLKRLGVNAIELMPVNEFEGNISWGYNPNYFFAVDKFYGTPNDLKYLIDKAHEKGMAVILDIVLNHAFNSSPLVQLYWNAAMNRPAADNPWFNQQSNFENPGLQWGSDFNHESRYTQQFVDSVNRYWLTEYKFDGFRFDFTKGFTNRPKGADDFWGSNYDPDRVRLLKRMTDRIREVKPNAYIIFEHLADNVEEKELADYGIMMWGNANHDYGNALKGDTNGNFNWSLAATRGWKENNLISYMESHDEERLMVYAIEDGARNGNYNIKDMSVALERMKLGAAFLLTVPGPKMIWQFGELGYDISINGCPPDGRRIDNSCRTDPKPIPWGNQAGLNYHLNTERMKIFGVYAALNRLRHEHEAFSKGNFSWQTNGAIRHIKIAHSNLNVVIVGNFGLAPSTATPGFPSTGTWYDYFTGAPVQITRQAQRLYLSAGQFHVLTDRPVNFPPSGLVNTRPPVVVAEPTMFGPDDEVRIIFDAAAAHPAGTNGLKGAQKVYMRAGVITTNAFGTNWEFIRGSQNQDDGIGLMTPVEGEPDKWQIVIRPRQYFGVPADRSIFRIAMFFRDANGQNLGKDHGGADVFLQVQQPQRVVITDPTVFTADMPVKIIFDATQADPSGTAGLIGAQRVYMHAGVVLNAADGTQWQNVIGNWGQDDGVGAMTRVPGQTDRWEITIRPREYFRVPAGTRIFRLAMVFRNANGTAEGKGPGRSDIFVNVAEALTTPAAPTNLIATATGPDRIRLTWTDNSLDETGFAVERSTNATTGFTEIASLPANASSFESTGLIPATQYFFRVRANGSGGFSAYSNVANATTDPPTSLAEDLSETAILYPNPSEGTAVLRMENSIRGWMEGIITDLSGRVVYREQVVKNAETLEWLIPVESLPAGMYLLNLTNGEYRIAKKLSVVK